MPKLRMSGAIPSVPPYSFMTCTGTAAPFNNIFGAFSTEVTKKSACYLHHVLPFVITLNFLNGYFIAFDIGRFYKKNFPVSVKVGQHLRRLLLKIYVRFRAYHVPNLLNIYRSEKLVEQN
jgi:hypothetical protein